MRALERESGSTILAVNKRVENLERENSLLKAELLKNARTSQSAPPPIVITTTPPPPPVSEARPSGVHIPLFSEEKEEILMNQLLEFLSKNQLDKDVSSSGFLAQTVGKGGGILTNWSPKPIRHLKLTGPKGRRPSILKRRRPRGSQ